MAKALPKTMGACADLLFNVREKRLAADKVAAELKAEEIRIQNHIIDNLSKRDETGAAGKHHRVQVKRKRKWRINPENWDKFYAWCAKNKRFDFLQKRISDQAFADHYEQARPKAIPGAEPFDYVTVSLTKV